VYVWAEITEHDLPAYFEEGETYKINISYLLPDACHTGLGLQVGRGGDMGDAYRDIYVAGFASYRSDLVECDEEDEDLEKESHFSIRINDDEPYTFYLWTGVDEDDENIYTEVVVPVGIPETEG
jgi:hypothetical protein